MDFEQYYKEIEKNIPASDPITKKQTEIEQKTFEWHLARIHCFTGSKMAGLMTQGRGKGEDWGATAMSVIYKMLALQTMTDEGREEYIMQEMAKDFKQTRWGNENEPLAREWYAKHVQDVVECGFMYHQNFDYIGGSADGVVKNGIIEIKCPYDPLVHWKYLSMQSINRKFEYYAQIQTNIEVYGVDYCDFITFDPRQSEMFRGRVIRVERDPIFISALMQRAHQGKIILDALKSGKDEKKAIELTTTL